MPFGPTLWYAPPDTQQKGCRNLTTTMSPPFPAVILFSILPHRSLFPKPTPLAQVGIHPCHNLARSLLLLLASSPSQRFLSSKLSYTAELCTAAEELAQVRPRQGPLSQFNSADDWIRGFDMALFISMNEAEPIMQFLGVFCLTLPFPFWNLDHPLHPTPSHLSQLLQRRWVQDRWGHGSVPLVSDTDALSEDRQNRRRGLEDAYTYRIFLRGRARKCRFFGVEHFRKNVRPFSKPWL